MIVNDGTQIARKTHAMLCRQVNAQYGRIRDNAHVCARLKQRADGSLSWGMDTVLGMARAAAAEGDLPTMLVVGRYRFGDVYRMPAIRSDGYHFVDIEDLDESVVRRIEPDVVLSALIGSGFDAAEIAEILEVADFDGRYRVLSSEVGDCNVVTQEIARLAPHVDFAIVDLTAALRERQPA